MVSETHYKELLGFFYFVLLDETVALQAAVTAAARIQRRARGIERGELNGELLRVMVGVSTEYLNHAHRIFPRAVSHGWTSPPMDAFIIWREFARNADSDTLMTSVLRLINGFEPEEIATAMGVTTGTVFHRVGRALEALGAAHKEPARGK